jgi:hypothetical protein
MSGSVKAGDREIWQNVVSRTNSLPSFPSASPIQEEGDGREIWQNVVSAAENVRSGEKQAENVAVLAQIFAQVNASMHFAVVHGLRWCLSDEAIVAQILLLFSTSSQLLIQGCTGVQMCQRAASLSCLAHDGATLRMRSSTWSTAVRYSSC